MKNTPISNSEPAAHSERISNSRPEANRANSQHSTGPRTPEGHACSSHNCYKHGLTARHVRVSPAEREAYDRQAPGPVAAEAVSRSFVRARATDVQAILETLTALGQAKKDAGNYWV